KDAGSGGHDMSIPFDDEFFGPLTWNERHRWYQAKVEFSPGHVIELSISAEGIDRDLAVEQAHEVFPRVQTQEPALRRAAADKLLALYNDHWREAKRVEPEKFPKSAGAGSAEKRIDADEFSRRIVLSSITIHPEGETDLWYDDGDLFAGHWILVSTDSKLQF